MSYRMLLEKNNSNYPIPKRGWWFRVVNLFSSTGELLKPVIDVQLEHEPLITCPYCKKAIDLDNLEGS